MPQIFQVLKCYKCFIFQVHLTKKSCKWECKLCGEKQSVKRHYGIGSSSECRMHVQKLNKMQGDKEESNLNSVLNLDNDDIIENCKVELKQHKQGIKIERQSKWDAYVKETDKDYNERVEPEYYKGKEVVLQIPKKQKLTNTDNEKTADSNNIANMRSNSTSNNIKLLQNEKECEPFSNLKNIERPSKSNENISFSICNKLPASKEPILEILKNKQRTNENINEMAAVTNEQHKVNYHQMNKHGNQYNKVSERKSKWAAYINENVEDVSVNNKYSYRCSTKDPLSKPNDFTNELCDQSNPLNNLKENTTVLHNKFVYDPKELADEDSRRQQSFVVYLTRNTNEESEEAQLRTSEGDTKYEGMKIINKANSLFCLSNDTDLDDLLNF